MATADQFYADPSALLKLYLNEPESRAMTAWRWGAVRLEAFGARTSITVFAEDFDPGLAASAGLEKTQPRTKA